jgi:Cns1/TTC4 Wheel domain
MALLRLDKIDEAEDAASRGLAIDPQNKSLQTAAKKIAERKAQVERVAAKRKAEEELARKQNLVLSAALRARQIRTRKTEQPPEMEDSKIRLVPDPLSPESSVEFPAVFLYPMDAQSDFVKGFSELHSIADHLDYIFPLPWDTKKEYTIDNVECFMQTVSGGLIKAGKKLPLLQILSGGKVEVIDELVRIFVVPIPKTGAFIAEMKARKEG